MRLLRYSFLRGGQLVGELRPKLHKSNAGIGSAAEGSRRAQNLWRSAAQITEFLPHELAAILFFEGKSHFDFPPEPPQVICGNQRITCVVAFSGEHNAFAGLRKKFRDCLRDTGACLVHERFDLHSA